MRITAISVKELFGLPTFNYHIELKMDKRITIIHGPNGSGKTVLFKMIDGLFNGHYIVFWKYPFREFVVTLEDNQTITVKREFDSEQKKYLVPEISYSKNKKPFKLDIDESQFRYIGISRQLRDLGLDNPFRAKRNLSFEEKELIINLLLQKERLDIDINSAFVEESWFESLRKKLNVIFISTGRLLTDKTDEDSRGFERNITIPSIIEISQELSIKIQEKIVEGDTEAKSLDRVFPNKIVNSIVREKTKVLSYEEIREELNELEKERERLLASGLLEAAKAEEQFQIPDIIDDEQQRLIIQHVLTIYIEDNKKKLGVYRELANRIELFKNIINELLRYKTLFINKNGFEFRQKTDMALPIPPQELSSGEQHSLVMIYNLLFRQQNKIDELILIDEPEISLHIAWQKRFISDLERINVLSNFDTIIATHAPSIINGKLDLMVGLEGSTDKDE